MATLTSRTLSRSSLFDRKAIRVDGATYAGLTGIIQVALGNLVATVTTCTGTVELRTPNYSATSGDLKVAVTVTTTTTTDLATNAFFSVNNGVPDPSVKVNADGTWDLLWLTTRMDITDQASPALVGSIVHTVTFTDLTPSSTNPSSGNATATLAVGPNAATAEAIIGISTDDLGSSGGYIKAWINSATQSVVLDEASLDAELGTFEAVTGNDSVDSPGFGLVNHSLPKIPGVKTYVKAMYVFAVNAGKIDRHGSMIAGESPQAAAVKCTLTAGSNSADEVSLAVSYNVTFTAV
jgi:hypothetical protein